MVRKQSNFSRSLANDAKMGAYYTDRQHCRRIGMLVDFPEEEVSVLDPCIGDGSALHEVLHGKEDSICVFAVEINNDVYQKHIGDNPAIKYSLNADFLTGIKVAHNAFGFCFMNPPYGKNEKGERLEQKFMEKMYPYMKHQAPIALVVPHYVLVKDEFLGSFLCRFKPELTYRFDDDVFKQFQQVVVIGIRKKRLGYQKDELCSYKDKIEEIENLPYLPNKEEEVKKKVIAVASPGEMVNCFATIRFDAKEAAKHLKSSNLYKRLEKAFGSEYMVENMNRPIIPLKPDLLYLLSICGGGQGLAGTEANGDLHLQRGVAKVKGNSQIEGEKKLVEKVRTSTSVELNIIENDGKITTLS